jgi:SAM-dependent methyltransferase
MLFGKIKLNVGASSIWRKDGWLVIDHKLVKSTKDAIAADAVNIDLPDNSCAVIFCSHVFEHIPHYNLPLVVAEINRILVPGGIFRILTPDLETLCKAYVDKDVEFFRKAKQEDESLRTDLGFGGMLMNFIVSPGQDTVLLDRKIKEFIGGYAHIYSYDYQMLSTILTKLGFDCQRSCFKGSSIEEMREPLHVEGLPTEWQNLNQEFFKKNNLVHRLIDGKYEINFKLTGFDRDPLTSLIIEAKKQFYVKKDSANIIFNESMDNYNRYGRSLLSYAEITQRLKSCGIKFQAKEA